MAPLPQAQHYTFADLLTWEDRTRYELYDGQPVALASPSNVHQEICMANLQCSSRQKMQGLSGALRRAAV